MWDSDTLFQLLQSMPEVLEEEHIQRLQMLIDADKYKNQLISGFDLCGQYAPFCNGCDKEKQFPCAQAYVSYMKSQGMDVELYSAVPVEETIEEKVEENTENIGDFAAQPVQNTEKIKIRIATARKKTLL